MEGGRLDSTWFHPLRLISIGVLSIDLLKHLPCQVIHSLKLRVTRYLKLKAAVGGSLRWKNPMLGEHN